MSDKIGLLAGKGELPKRIIDHCVKEGRPYHILAFKDQTEADWLSDHPHDWVRLGAGGTSVKILKEQGVQTLVMAGPIKRPSMVALRPDAWGLKFLAKTGKAAFGDDGILKALVNTLEKEEGFKVIGAHDLLGTILAQEKIYTDIKPDDLAESDIKKAMMIAHEIGKLDVGQAVVVQDGLVLAVEAIEGTDNLLKRCLNVKRDGPGGVLVKAKKPEQENRADLPTIGLETVKNAHAAGLRGIAVEAGGAIILDENDLVQEANKLGLFVMGIKS